MPWKETFSEEEHEELRRPDAFGHHIHYGRIITALEWAAVTAAKRKYRELENGFEAWDHLTKEGRPLHGLRAWVHDYAAKALAAVDPKTGHKVEQAYAFLERLTGEVENKVREHLHLRSDQ